MFLSCLFLSSASPRIQNPKRKSGLGVQEEGRHTVSICGETLKGQDVHLLGWLWGPRQHMSNHAYYFCVRHQHDHFEYSWSPNIACKNCSHSSECHPPALWGGFSRTPKEHIIGTWRLQPVTGDMISPTTCSNPICDNISSLTGCIVLISDECYHWRVKYWLVIMFVITGLGSRMGPKCISHQRFHSCMIWCSVLLPPSWFLGPLSILCQI